MNSRHHKYAAVSVDGDLVTVNEYPQPYVRKSRREARRVGQMLPEVLGVSVAAHGIVVIVNAGHLAIRQQPETSSSSPGGGFGGGCLPPDRL
jgi:hypothetical protein